MKPRLAPSIVRSCHPVLAAVLAISLALALVACRAQATPRPVPPTPTSAPTPVPATPVPPTPTPEPTATPTPLSAHAILQAAFEAAQQATSYRFEMDMWMMLSGADIGTDREIPMRFLGVVQPPDRMQGTMSMSIEDVDVETQVVVIGEEAYVLNPLTNKWQLSPQTASTLDPKDLVMDPSDIRDLELLGEDILEDVPVYHLSGRATLPFSLGEPLGEMEAEMLLNYWINRNDLQVMRSTIEGDMDIAGQVDASATVSATARLFDYGVPVEITAPEIAATTAVDVPDVGSIAVEATLLAPLDSDTPEGHVQRGLASLADGRLGLALAHFDRALALRPDWPDALLYRGATLAIDGDLETAFADLDRAIEADPERADAYALRAWTRLRALLRNEAESETAISEAREDIDRSLEWETGLTSALALKASADVWEALALFESEPDQAVEDFKTAMADLKAVLNEDPDSAAGLYLTMLATLMELNAEDSGWLVRQVDEAGMQLTNEPRYYAAYAERGVAKLLLGSLVTPDLQTLQEAGEDLMASIALLHDHISDLADPAGGPLQVAHVWDLQEAAYSIGTLYLQVFFGQNPQLFPEFAQMLTSYWELHDLFIQIVDDPIIFDVAFSPDGSQIATLSESGPSYLRFWDAATGDKVREVELGLDGQVIATTNGNLAYSPDGNKVVTAYTNPVARVIDTETGEVTLELVHDRSIHSAAFSPDGTRILTVDPVVGVPVLWDAETGERLLTMTVDSRVSTAVFSPDARRIVGGGEQVQLWDAETGELTAALPGYASPYVTAPVISPDGELLAVPGYPATVYDLLTETKLFTVTTGARTLAFSPDGTRLATAGIAAGLWDSATGDMIFLAGHPGGVDSVAFSPDGRLLVTGGPDGRFRVWDADTGAELWSAMAATLWWEATDREPESRPETSVFPAQTADREAVDAPGLIIFTQAQPDGMDLFAASSTGADFIQLTTSPSVEFDARWSPDASRIAYKAYDPVTGGTDLWILDPAAPGTARAVSSDGMAAFEHYAWAPDGRSILYSAPQADGSEMDVYRLDIESGELVVLTADYPGWDASPAWSPDGQWIAFVSDRSDEGKTLDDIWLMRPGGSDLVNLTDNGDAWEDVRPAWSPDGT